MYQQKKTDYQRGYEDGEELIVTHVNLDGRSKAKEYIQKLADKNKGKTDALNDFINNSASYFVPPQILQEYNISKKNNMGHNKVKNKAKLTESQLRSIIKESVKCVLKEGHWNSAVYDEFSELREMLGDDTLISEMYNWMDAHTIEKFIQHTKQIYDLDGYDEEEDDDIIL